MIFFISKLTNHILRDIFNINRCFIRYIFNILLSILYLGFLVTGCTNVKDEKSEMENIKVNSNIDIEQLLILSREATWTFPSSSGRPLPKILPEWFARVSSERNSFVKAVSNLLKTGNYDSAFEIAANVWRLWIIDGDDLGGSEFLNMTLKHISKVKQPHLQAMVLYGASLFDFRLGNIESSRKRSIAALNAALTGRNVEAELLALLALSRVDLEEGNSKSAINHSLQSLQLSKDFSPALGQSPLHILAQATRLSGNLEEASRLFQQSLKLNRQIGDKGMVIVELHNLGHVELRLGHVNKAEELFKKLEELGRGGDPYGTAMSLFNKASIAFVKGDLDTTEILLKQARKTLHDANIIPATDDAAELDRLERQLRSIMNEK